MQVFVYVCVYVCVYVFVCVIMLFHREGFFRLQDVWDKLEGYGSTMLCCEYHSRCFCKDPSFSCLKKLYFTSKDKILARRQLERRRNDIWFREKTIYVAIGYKWATQQTGKWRKNTKYKEATLV